MDRLRLPAVRVLVVEPPHPAAAGAVRGTAANGYIVASRRAALSADTPGRIVAMLVEEGSVVREGEVVARLYAKEYAAALHRAESDLEAARARALRAEAQVAQAQADRERLRAARVTAEASVEVDRANLALAGRQYERFERLVPQGASSEEELDRAREARDGARARVEASVARVAAARAEEDAGAARVAVARADLALARAQVEVAAASRDQAAATLEKTEVRAPFDGVVVLKDAEVGEVVSPNSRGGSSARGSVCTMVDFDSLEVQAEVPETSLRAVRRGGPARIFLDAYPDRSYEGRVDRIWPTANRQKATVEVRVAFAQPDDLLRPEMGVRVVFLLPGDEAPPVAAAGPEAVLLVPEAAVFRTGGADAVFVIERDVVRLRRIQVAERRGGRVAVREGLEAGERIVLDPPGSLADGGRVRLRGGET